MYNVYIRFTHSNEIDIAKVVIAGITHPNPKVMFFHVDVELLENLTTIDL